MRVFIVGSYTYEKEAYAGFVKPSSDIDVLLTNDELVGYVNESEHDDEAERESFIQEFEHYALENGGLLDLFLDKHTEWLAVYSKKAKRRLFGQHFVENIDRYALPNAREVTKEELHQLLSTTSFEERFLIMKSILNRPHFLNE